MSKRRVGRGRRYDPECLATCRDVLFLPARGPGQHGNHGPAAPRDELGGVEYGPGSLVARAWPCTAPPGRDGEFAAGDCRAARESQGGFRSTLTSLARAEAVLRRSPAVARPQVHVSERPLVLVPLAGRRGGSAMERPMVGDRPCAPRLAVVAQADTQHEASEFDSRRTLAAVVSATRKILRSGPDGARRARARGPGPLRDDAADLVPNPAGIGFTPAARTVHPIPPRQRGSRRSPGRSGAGGG